MSSNALRNIAFVALLIIMAMAVFGVTVGG
ncbi:MAG: hypothetical protein ACJAXT_000588 [Paracoccaceae bacterium]|jgi:hypothetical protein